MLFKKDKEPETLLGRGYSLKDPKRKIKQIALPDSHRKGHFWCFGTTRSGKAQTLDAKVLTPDGWRYMGDLKVGDKVITPYSKSFITGIYPQGIMDIYLVTLEDGRQVQATADHLWLAKYKNKTDILETRKLKSCDYFLPIYNENAGVEKFIAIRSIEKIKQDEAQCISIDDERGLYITNDYIVTHNTRLMENMIEQDIRKGYSTVILDPKGDIDLFSKIVQVAMEEQRTNELIFVTPIFPQYSAVVDPLSYYYMPEELVAHIVSGVEGGREPFFYNVAYEISLAVVNSFIMKAKSEGKATNFNLLDIKNSITHESLKKIKDEISIINDEKSVQLARDLQSILDSPQDYYSKVSSSLRVTLTELTSGNVGRIIGTADSNRFIKYLEKGNRVILIVHLGSLLTSRAAFTVGKVILSMIQSYVGRVFSSGEQVNPPLSIFVDEAQNVLYNRIDDFFAKGGGANVWLHGFCQSVSQIYAELGEEKGNAILDNTNSKVFMRVPDTVTAEYVSGFFGKKKFFSPILGAGGSVTTRETEDYVVRAEDVLQLKPRQFYYTSYDGIYKGITNDVSESYIDVKFPKPDVQGRE